MTPQDVGTDGEPTTSLFSLRVATRGYEIDFNGHVAGTVLLQYCQHARWGCMRAAGLDEALLLNEGIGPVSLEEQIRFHHELRIGDEVDVSCSYEWGSGKTFRVHQEIRLTNETLVAEVTNVGGLLDHTRRKLVAAPRERLRAAAARPELLGIAVRGIG